MQVEAHIFCCRLIWALAPPLSPGKDQLLPRHRGKRVRESKGIASHAGRQTDRASRRGGGAEYAGFAIRLVLDKCREITGSLAHTRVGWREEG